MQKCFRSTHIHLSDQDQHSLIQDILAYNLIKRTVVQQKKQYDPEAMGRSLFLHMRDRFDQKTVFINSAIREAEANIRSYEALRKQRIQETKDQVKIIKKKIKTTEKRLKGLLFLKQSLIRYSKAMKHGQQRLPKIKGTTWERANEDGSFSICSFGQARKSYTNLYDFEIFYLDPKIKGLKSRIRNLQNRLDHKEHVLLHLQDESSWSICFGSKALFKKQRTTYASHSVWKRKWQQARNHSMILSGRRDLIQGNAMVRYDTDRHILTYRAQDGNVIQCVCTFPYGQEEIDDALSCRNGYDKQAIAWAFERTGQSFIVKCLLPMKEIDRNTDRSTGVIGFDTNYDNLAVSETDGNGNLLKHRIFPFDIENKTTHQIEQLVSEALEQVFRWADDTHKPVVMEDLSIKKRGEAYQRKKKNRKLSLFASTKVTEFAESKAYKYQVDLIKVFPAYTSIIGKAKYMAAYGLSIHEAASFVIARRGMGYKERLPKMYRSFLNQQQKQSSLWSQWKLVYKKIKETDARTFCMYRSLPIASKSLSY